MMIIQHLLCLVDILIPYTMVHGSSSPTLYPGLVHILILMLIYTLYLQICSCCLHYQIQSNLFFVFEFFPFISNGYYPYVKMDPVGKRFQICFKRNNWWEPVCLPATGVSKIIRLSWWLSLFPPRWTSRKRITFGRNVKENLNDISPH